MNASMILMIVLGLLALFYGFVVYKSAANWLIGEILLLIGIFFGGAGFAVLAAMSLKTHQGWQQRYDQLEQELKEELKQVKLREKGDLVGVGSDVVSLPEATGELNRYLVDRGRVWRNLVPVDVQPGAITLDVSNWGERQCVRVGEQQDDLGIVPQPDLAAAAAEAGGGDAVTPRSDVRPHQIVPNSVVFAFVERALSEFKPEQKNALEFSSEEGLSAPNNLPDVCRLPVFYLGQFRVTKVAEQVITVWPLKRLHPSQQQAIQKSPGATWVFYDLLPRDGHDVFKDLSKEALVSIFQDIGQDEREKLLDEYLRDNQPAERTDAPDRLVKEVQFAKEHTISVDVEGEPPGIERSFDSTGRAVLAHLRLGNEVEFEEEDVARFDGETAQKLVDSGVAKFTEKPATYRRALRSYQELFFEQSEQAESVEAQAKLVTADTQSLVEAATKVNERIAYREQEKGELAADLAKFTEEVSIINNYVQQLEASVQRLERDIQEIKEANQRLIAGNKSARRSAPTSAIGTASRPQQLAAPSQL